MRSFLLIALTLAATGLVTSCDRNNDAPPDVGSDTGRPRDAGPDAPGTDAPGTDAPGTDAPGTDAPGTDAPGTDVPGTDAGPPCDDPTGCWACPPEIELHLLNGCTDAACEPFANDSTRLPLLLSDGSLPPLP
jgi:hypothetical protein